MTTETKICTRCGQTGHRASHCPLPVPPITPAEAERRMRAFGQHLGAILAPKKGTP
jgi:hypothetical protein